jgi:hypothetical protein
MSGWDDSTRTRPTRAKEGFSCRSPGKDLNPALEVRRGDLPTLVRHSRARRRMLQARGRRVDAMRRGQSSPDPAGARAQLCDARAKKKADLEGGSADPGGLPEVVSNSILACVLVTPWRPGGWAWCARVDVVSSSSYCEKKLSRRLYPKLYRVVVSSYPSYVRLSILPDENELLAFITCRPPPFPTSHIIASG